MEEKKSELVEKIEEVFHDLGDFSWKDAEIWAGFCHAVGMDPVAYLNVMMNNICTVCTDSSKKIAGCPAQLKVKYSGRKTRLKLED